MQSRLSSCHSLLVLLALDQGTVRVIATVIAFLLCLPALSTLVTPTLEQVLQSARFFFRKAVCNLHAERFLFSHLSQSLYGLYGSEPLDQSYPYRVLYPVSYPSGSNLGARSTRPTIVVTAAETPFSTI
jgi:hypothetical protein